MTEVPGPKRYPSQLCRVTLAIGTLTYTVLKRTAKNTHRTMNGLAAMYIMRGLREDGYRLEDELEESDEARET